MSSSGQLFFLHQRQKYEIVTDDEEIESGHVGLCRPLLCPISLPLKEYASSDGLQSVTQIERTFEEFGENSFAIPMPTWLDLYKEQLASPIAVFQLLCCVLWMLDEYWKYTRCALDP